MESYKDCNCHKNGKRREVMKTFKTFVAEKKLSQKDIQRALASIKPPKKKPTLPKAPWDDKEQKEAKVDEISMGKMQAYGKAAAKDIEKHRNTVKGALDQPASPKKADAGLKSMQQLRKRSRGSDMYVDKMTGRSKVKPTAEATVDEISNYKMGQYVRKATDDAARRAMDAGEKAGRGDSKGFGKQMVKSRQRVKGVQKAMDKMDKNRLYGRQ